MSTTGAAILYGGLAVITLAAEGAAFGPIFGVPRARGAALAVVTAAALAARGHRDLTLAHPRKGQPGPFRGQRPRSDLV